MESGNERHGEAHIVPVHKFMVEYKQHTWQEVGESELHLGHRQV